jgi:integrase
LPVLQLKNGPTKVATIIPKNSGFLARVRLQGFKPVARAFDKRADAAQWAASVEAAMRAGRYCPDPDSGAAPALLTFAEALRKYRAAVGDRLKGADTYAYWFDELEACTLAAKPLPDVSAFDVSAWRDRQALELSASTVVRKLGLLSGFFSWAQKERGWIDRNPVASVRKPRVNDARDRVLTAEERRHLLAGAACGRTSWMADALLVLLQSAMRRGELAGLRRADVDFTRSTAHLSDTKNGSARDVPLCPVALAALRRLDSAAAAREEQRRQDPKHTPCDNPTLLPVLHPHALTLAFRRAVERGQANYRAECAKTGAAPASGFLADLRLHDCRHAAITQWASSGALSVLHLQAISGHKTPRMLSRYTHLDASALAKQMGDIAARAAA